MNKVKKILEGLLVLGIFLVPLAALGVGEVETGMRDLRILFPVTGPGGARSIPQFIAEVIKILLLVAGAVAVLFVVIGGYYWMTAGGNDEQAEKGKKTLTNAIIGIVVVLLSYVIISVVVNLVSGLSWF